MAKIKTSCPHCGAEGSADAQYLGKKGRCPRCKQTFVFAAPAAAASAPPKTVSPDGVAQTWKPGKVLLDLYEVKSVLGEGGMGKVFKVHHKGWNVDLAVKTPRPEILTRKGAVENFETEAETWVNLGLHPHTVSCYYVRRVDGLPLVFAEYVEGGSLQDWIRQEKLYEGGPKKALERILDITIQFAWGLHYAHEQGLIHQDVKPANVMMTKDGTAKVTDFGLAKARAVAGDTPVVKGQSILVSTGGMTPAYCSPEQANRGKLTRKTDIWSWAASVLEMFTGEVTWPSGTVAGEALEGYLEMGAGDDRLPKMPLNLAELLRRCFQKNPDTRPKDMLEVVESLKSVFRQVKGQDYPREKPKPVEALADTLNNRAMSMLDLGKREGAEQALEEALRVEPHHPEANYNRELLRWRSGQATDTDVVQALEAVRVAHPSIWMAAYLLSLVHLERADAESAVRLLEETSKRFPEETSLRQVLQTAQQDRGGSGRCVHTLQGERGCFSPDGRRVLSRGRSSTGVDPAGTLRVWDVASGACLHKVTTHCSELYSACFSPDGRLALSGGSPGTLQLWDVETGQCLRVLEGHTKEVYVACFSPDGRRALSAGVEWTLRLWDVAAGTCLRTLAVPKETYSNNDREICCFSPDGSRLLSRGVESSFRLLDMASGACVRVFEGHERGLTLTRFSPDGRLILSVSTDKTLRLWDVDSGRCLHTISHKGEPACFSPDGQTVLAGGEDKALQLWEVATGGCLRTFRGHTDTVYSVCFRPDGRLALSASGDQTVRLWEVATGRCLRTFGGFTKSVFSASFSPDGRLAMAACLDRKLPLWDVAAVGTRVAPHAIARPARGEQVAGDQSRFTRLLGEAGTALSDGRLAAAIDAIKAARAVPGFQQAPAALAVAGELGQKTQRSGVAGAWHLRTVAHGEKDRFGCVSADGRLALVGGGDHRLQLWDVQAGRCLKALEGHASNVNARCLSPDGRLALSADEDTFLLWDLSTGRCLRTLLRDMRSAGNRPQALSFSPDGRWALSGHFRGLRLWEVATGRCLRNLNGEPELIEAVGPPEIIQAVCFSPDGRFSLSAGEANGVPNKGNHIWLWELGTGRCLRTMATADERVEALCFSPDGRHAVAAGRRVTLWEVATGKPLRTFDGHRATLSAVCFSPDGRWLLSAGGWMYGHDYAVRVWDVETGQCLRTLEGHTAEVSAVCFRPNGHRALSVSVDGTLREWQLDWEFELNQPADWDEGARPFVTAFLTIHTPYADDMVHRGKPIWTQDDFRRLLDTLGCAGYGWLRPEGVRRELEKMASTWQGPPPLPGTT